jgi:hypothetical protein
MFLVPRHVTRPWVVGVETDWHAVISQVMDRIGRLASGSMWLSCPQLCEPGLGYSMVPPPESRVCVNPTY